MFTRLAFRSMSIALVLCATVLATTFYIAPPPAGSDSNAGDIDNPWATFDRANNWLSAGDTVLVREGTYTIDAPIEPPKSGREDAWITYAGYPGETAVLEALEMPVRASGGMGAFHIEDLSYFRLQNLTIQNSKLMGIMVLNSEHIEILGNTTIMTYCCGIGVWGCSGSWCPSVTFSRDIKVIGNHVDRPNMPEMYLDESGDLISVQDGVAHEGISIATVDGFEVAYNHVHHGKKEGIDIKEASRNGTVHNNYVHHHLNRPWTVGIYMDTWFDSLYNVEVYHNRVHDCDDGIGVAAEEGPIARDLFIHHNVIYTHNWRGIYLDQAGDDNHRTNVWIYNNTVYDAGIWVQSQNVDSVFILNNICVGSGNQRMMCEPDMASHDIVIDYNLFDNIPSSNVAGTNAVVGSPAFTNAGQFDFTLLAGSDAIDAGNPDARWNDSDGSRCDIGAIPFGELDPSSVRDQVPYRVVRSAPLSLDRHAPVFDLLGRTTPRGLRRLAPGVYARSTSVHMVRVARTAD